METVKKTTSLRISEAQKPKRTSLIHIISELNEKVNMQPIKMKKAHIKFDDNDNAEHRLKLKTTSSFMKVLLTKKSIRTIIEKKRMAAPIPTGRLDVENSKVRHEIIKLNITSVNM